MLTMNELTELRLCGIYVPKDVDHNENIVLMQTIGVAKVVKHFDRNATAIIIMRDEPDRMIIHSLTYDIFTRDLPVKHLHRSMPDRAGIVSILMILFNPLEPAESTQMAC